MSTGDWVIAPGVGGVGRGLEWVLHLLLVSTKKGEKEKKKVVIVNAASWQTLAITEEKTNMHQNKNFPPKERTMTNAAPC